MDLSTNQIEYVQRLLESGDIDMYELMDRSGELLFEEPGYVSGTVLEGLEKEITPKN